MSRLPLRPLWQAIASQIDSLGINQPERQFPFVMIDQLEMQDTFETKDTEACEATFVVDVITSGDSPDESIDIIERVRETLTEERITVDGFTVDRLTPEALTPIHDAEEGVWRQVQRYRIVLLTEK